MNQSNSFGPEVSTIGKYQLIANLGHGGMADVYLAVVHGPVGFNKLTVVKRLRPNLADEPEFLAMFLDEARLAARLNHPNVVQTNEVSEFDGIYYIAMEYLDGQPLNRVLHRANKTGGIPRGLGLRIVADALAGLHHAHELADYDGTPLYVVHRDSSPHNIFVTYDGQTKVVDFGIAKAATRSAETRGGVLKGKIAYMAPEQARGADVDRRSDVFAMGLVFWEVLTGERLRSGGEIEILDNIARGDVPTLSSKISDCPPALERILALATAISKEDRYATANDMRQDILSYLETTPSRSTAEEVGNFLSAQFDAKRTEMRAIIERQLSGLRRASTEDVGLRIIDARRLGTDSMELPRLSLTSNSSMTPPASITSGNIPPSGTGAFTSSSVHRGHTPTPTLASTELRNRTRAPLAIALVAVAAGVTVLALRKGADPPSPPAAAATVATSVAAGPTDTAVAPATIEVHLAAKPQASKLFLDDTALETNPYVGKFRRDDKPHTLRVEADGFVTLQRPISFGSNVTIEVALDRAEAQLQPPRDRPAGAPPTTAQPTTSPDEPEAPPPKPRPQKPLDGDDPWQ